MFLLASRRRWLHLLASALLTLNLSLVNEPQVAHAQECGIYVQSLGAYDGNPWGTRADIETANPQIPSGQWSWARATVQYNPPGTNYYAEVGWWKDTQGFGVNTVSNDPSGYFSYVWLRPNPPTIGSTHKYTVIWSDARNGYDLSYDGTYLTTRPASFNLARVFSGGEAYACGDAIGISGCLNNEYAATNGGGWTLYPSHYPQVTPGYWRTYITNYSWQVGGFN